MRWTSLAAVLLLTGCGDSNPYHPARPTDVPVVALATPEPPIFVDLSGPPPPPPGLPATVPNVAGAWPSGLLTLTDRGIGVSALATVTATQADRAVIVTWNAGQVRGEIRGTINGLGADAVFVGTQTMTAPTSSPGARCTITGAVQGRAFPSWMWLLAPTVTLSGCTGDVRDVRITAQR